MIIFLTEFSLGKVSGSSSSKKSCPFPEIAATAHARQWRLLENRGSRSGKSPDGSWSARLMLLLGAAHSSDMNCTTELSEEPKH